MANRFLFNQDVLKEEASLEIRPSLDLNVAAQQTAAQATLLQAEKALNTEVMLSSSFLKYDVVYKPPTKEVFTVAEQAQEAALEHIDQLGSALSRFNASLKTLQDDLGQEDVDNDVSLRAKTRAFLDKYQEDADVAKLMKQELHDGDLRTYRAIFAARNEDITALSDNASKLFHSGRLLMKETQAIGDLHNQLLLLQRTVLKRLLSLREQKQQLATQVTEARQQLDALNRTRLEDAGDYALAQRLVRDDWHQVESRFQQRRKILEAHLGLYYVRVRESAVGSLLPDVLDLRAQSAGDVVPGCPDSDWELPDALTPFLDTVLDIPLADWRLFEKDAHLLPSRWRQTQMFDQRRLRLTAKANRGMAASSQQSLRLMPLLQLNSQIVSVFAGAGLPKADSLQQQLSHAHRLLSLEDVLNGSRSLLSGRAQTLQAQLAQAVACFLERLTEIQPSIRFRWAQLVEDNRLPVDQPERWPNLADVERSDLRRVRTLVELVHWFYRQLADDAGDNSRTAMTHLLSACLLIAASDDPEQILYGSLKTLPGEFKPGVLLRLDLNREALPGTSLQLLNAERQVVGLLRVDDHDQNGAVATVMQMYQSVGARGGFSVSGKMALGRAALK